MKRVSKIQTASNRWANNTPNLLIYAENWWTCGPFPLRCPSESSNILFVSVDRPSPNLNTKFQLNCVWKGWGYFRGDDFLCSGKKKLTILCFEQINLQPPPKQKVSNYTWELQPRCSTSGCNNVCSFQTPRKRWEWQLKAGTHIPKGVLLTVGEVGFLSYPKKKTWKEGKTNALHVSHMFLTICFLILTSFSGNIWKILNVMTCS